MKYFDIEYQFSKANKPSITEEDRAVLPYTVTDIGEGKESLEKWKLDRVEIERLYEIEADKRREELRNIAISIIEEHNRIGKVNSTEIEEEESHILSGLKYTSPEKLNALILHEFEFSRHKNDVSETRTQKFLQKLIQLMYPDSE